MEKLSAQDRPGPKYFSRDRDVGGDMRLPVLSDPNLAFGAVFLLSVAWIGFWLTLSVFYRRSRRKPIFPALPHNARFARARLSGFSDKNLMSRIGGAKNCLLVAVTDTTLSIVPSFPFNLLFLPEIYDLEHNIPLGNVISATKKPGLLGSLVNITFQTHGEKRRVQLRLRKADELIAALRP
ncbi:MAG TPA: hypothetical protein VG839_00425 [Asticcacaulis sp.]|nr:hypothetical protein [Asticcacaulis sp.]